MMRLLVLLSLAAALVGFSTGAVAEEEKKEARILPVGARVLLGVAKPDNADAGFLLGGAVNLGTVWKPWVHLSAGATRWKTDIDAARFGGRTGTLSDLRLFTNVGLEFIEISGIQGYLDLGLATHFLDASIPGDPELANAVGGTNFAGEVAYGLASTRGSLRISAEVRRQYVDDASNWSFALGVGTRWGREYKSVAAPLPVQIPVGADTSIPAPAGEPDGSRYPARDVEQENALYRVRQAEAETRSWELETARAENRELRNRVDDLSREFGEFRESANRAELERLRADQKSLREELEQAKLESLKSTDLAETQNGLLLSINSSLLFASGRSDLEPGGGQELERVAGVVRRFPGAYVIVEGHTDNLGQESQNRVLSQERADVVRNRLIRAGLVSSHVQAVGYGPERPLTDNGTVEGRARNRRVNIRVLPLPPEDAVR